MNSFIFEPKFFNIARLNISKIYQNINYFYKTKQKWNVLRFSHLYLFPSSTKFLFFINLNDSQNYNLQVIDSYINELILEKGVSFLGLIPSISSYSEVLALKTFFQSIFERVVETNCSKAADLDKLWEYEKLSFDAEKSKVLKRKILENVDIIKRRIIEKYIVMSEYYLVDFNWNVNV